MAFKIQVRAEEGENVGLSSIVTDLITSAAFFKKKEINIKQEGNAFTFIFDGHCPNEYLRYLSCKYDLSLDYVKSEQ